MAVERRRYPRFEVVAQVELEADDETLMMPLRNLSLGGALLSLPSPDAVPPLQMGDAVSAFVDFGSDLRGENLALSLEAEIVRVEQSDTGITGVAVRWVGGSEQAQSKLAEIVARLSADDSQRLNL